METTAQRASNWARQVGSDGKANYEELISELNRARLSLSPDELRTSPKTCALAARIEARMEKRGMPQGCYPVLVRVAIMDYPQLARVARPKWNKDLDSQAGSALLQLLTKEITGHRPCVRNWKQAVDA